MSGCRKLAIVIAVVVALPVVIGALSTFFFCRAVAPTPRSGASARAPAYPPPDAIECTGGVKSPCGAAVAAFEAAGRADSDALKRLLSDPKWLDQLPAAATSTPNERGRFYVRMLVSDPPAALEELRDRRPWKLVPVHTRTALDGRKALVVMDLRVGEEQPRDVPLEMQLVDGAWTMVPPTR